MIKYKRCDEIEAELTELKNRTCSNCIYYTRIVKNKEPFECNNESLNKMDENLDASDYYFRPSKDFGCNKWSKQNENN
jgi:hypothetical protein